MPKPVSQPRPAARRETDLYASVRDFLGAQGFTVRAEVNRCDIAATRGDQLVVVELKTAMGLDLLLQAVKRQRVADSVYVAIPRPESAPGEARLRALRPLLRRLELGLLVVDLRHTPAPVSVFVQPQPVQRRRDVRTRRAILQEIAGRSGDDNAGGSTRRPLVTAYRERALFIAETLRRSGAMSPRQLRALGAGPKTLSIVRSDVYGWFERVDRALYGIKPAAVQALERYADVVVRLMAARDATSQPRPAITAGAGAKRKARAATPAASP